MPSFNPLRVTAFSAVLMLMVTVLGACAMSPQKLAYRDRLEMGISLPEDLERFKTTEREQSALIADARSMPPRRAQAGDIQLIQAAATGDTVRMAALLTSGAHVNAVDAQNQNALLVAARAGEVEAVRLLLKAGAYADGRGGEMPPLAAAALRGHTMVVRLLIRNGADVDGVGENAQSALMNAVKLKHLGVVQVLIEAGASQQVLDRAGDNLLTVAVTDNNPEMLALLLSLGVNPDLADSNGLTALYWAEYLKRPELALLLRKAGADPLRKKTALIVSQPYNFGEF